ncbi:hypothetical protein DNZ22_18320 [Salmonella enterica subsp. enterica serovar Newport]|nr:hypothetical protein [Salmonella enterica subsp. enterica serovar Newport]
MSDSINQSVLGMSDADFLKQPMPTFESASSQEEQVEEVQQTEETQDTSTQNQEQETTTEQSEETTEQTTQEDNTQEQTTETQTETTSEESNTEEQTTSDNVPDAEAQLKKLFTPFKANGRELKVDSVDEAITLMQQGANYNKKMAALKPSLKILKMLENNGLLDEGKLTYLIDIDKKNPEAIAKLIKESGIDPLDVNVQEEPKYKPGNYSVSDAQVNLDSVLDSIEHSPTYERTMTVITQEWDNDSKRVLANDPGLIPLINQHMSNGIFDMIDGEITKQRALGNLSGLSDLQAYEAVGKQLAQKGAFASLQNNTQQQPVETKAHIPTQTDTERAAKRKAASPTKQSQTTKEETNLNPLAMSDEEFEKAFNSKFR